jgi:ADP-ribosyl-[dinitrogen reductase] hydrolase
MISTLERFEGTLLGLAAGDAVGTTAEFKPRGSFPKLTDMTGGGPFGLEPGKWTDDTSMALCLATSLIKKNGFDPSDQMDRYWRWFQNGYLSSTDRCFDIGNTVRDALERFYRTSNPFSGDNSRYSAGNGSIMRLAPIPMFYFSDLQKTLHFAAESSRTTHGAMECIEACKLFSEMIFMALSGMNKEEILFKTTVELSETKIKEISSGNYTNKLMGEIHGTGYVVSCLETALWCFYKTATFEAAILLAANLGDDADTTAAVCGQIAGAYYGKTGIPENWLDRLYMKSEIIDLANQLLKQK